MNCSPLPTGSFIWNNSTLHFRVTLIDSFAVEHLSVEKLLIDWRWLCPQTVSLVARNAFGDLFLRDQQGKILWLDVAIGAISEVADSLEKFKSAAESEEMKQKWFAASDEQQAANRGLVPGPEQCIGFATPLVLSESGNSGNPYIANIYDHLPFLGDLHRQIANLPDGTKVKLVVKDAFSSTRASSQECQAK